MSAIAKVLIQKGLKVSGSDMSSSTLTAELESLGARIYLGHNAANVNGAEIVIRSSAIPDDNPEIQEARSKGLPVLHRSEILAMLLNENRGIAVSGAHGKTTITGMIATILEMARLDPSVLVGGELVGTGFHAKYGMGPYVVAEADESDGSFLKYHPFLAVVTSIEADHLENYGGSFTNLIKAYQAFLGQLKPGGVAVVGAQAARMLQGQLPSAVTYGLDDPDCDYTGRILRLEGFDSQLEVSRRGRVMGTLELKMPGAHNLENALAASAACLELGLEFSQIKEGLAQFQGIKRRFQLVQHNRERDILIIDDYGHHPTELRAALRAAKEIFGRRVVAVFQPHRFNRTQFLFDEFANSFSDADVVAVAPIYAPPPETPIPGVSSEKLAEAILAVERKPVEAFSDLGSVTDWLADNLRSGDLVITLGAGNIGLVGQALARRLD